VQSVLGLVEDDGLRRVEHFVGGFHAAGGGQAVHHATVFGSAAEEVRVDLIERHERRAALGNLALLADPPPQVRIEEVGVANRPIDIRRDRDRAAGDGAIFRRERANLVADLVSLGGRMREMHAHAGADGGQ
jgi:hypothetical protein